MAQITDPSDLQAFHHMVITESERLDAQCRQWTAFMKEHAPPASTNGTDQVDHCDKENAVNDTKSSEAPSDSNGNSSPSLELTEDDLGRIRTTIGQAQLLMKERFGQFTNLVDQAMNKTSKLPIGVSDLLGFWEMVAIQVEDVDRKFAALSPLALKTAANNNGEQAVGGDQQQSAAALAASRTANKT